MSVFDKYARYYDLLYRDKNYVAEVNFVGETIRKYASEARSLLELGCGTGIHAQHLAALGFTVHGVDISERMLEGARARQKALPPQIAEALSFSKGDVRNARLEKTFDAVISLFHVMSYQVGNADLKAAFLTAGEHLEPGGLFVFDCWYGPAVLSDRPVVRVKCFEDETTSITRIAEPVMHPNDNVVDVGYRVLIKDKESGAMEEIRETHRMRYLFRPEIAFLCAISGFEIVTQLEWLSGNEPGFDTWGVCFVLRLCEKKF
jgi:SAM-dependent methyltransferase